jgi:hypothetical protein
MRFEYYIPDHDETAEDAREVDCLYCDPEDVAEAAAEYCHVHRNGWEWSWPIVFAIIGHDGTETRLSVDRVAVPEFRARRVKAKETTP